VSDYSRDEIEAAFIRILSTHGNQIGKSTNRAERRERVRQAIFASGQANESFMGEGITFCEAFRVVYGERLDRRAAMRTLPDPDDVPEPDRWE
jgi:hypothetical protein